MLPPLQSVVELTTAHVPPSQQTAMAGADSGDVDMRAESAAGHLLQDGTGTLPDGSTYERLSGREKGANGYWCKCGLPSDAPVALGRTVHRQVFPAACARQHCLRKSDLAFEIHLAG